MWANFIFPCEAPGPSGQGPLERTLGCPPLPSIRQPGQGDSDLLSSCCNGSNCLWRVLPRASVPLSRGCPSSPYQEQGNKETAQRGHWTGPTSHSCPWWKLDVNAEPWSLGPGWVFPSCGLALSHGVTSFQGPADAALTDSEITQREICGFFDPFFSPTARRWLRAGFSSNVRIFFLIVLKWM